MPKNELQLCTTCDMRYTKPINTITPLKPRNIQNNITKANGETVTDHLVKRQSRQQQTVLKLNFKSYILFMVSLYYDSKESTQIYLWGHVF